MYNDAAILEHTHERQPGTPALEFRLSGTWTRLDDLCALVCLLTKAVYAKEIRTL